MLREHHRIARQASVYDGSPAGKQGSKQLSRHVAPDRVESHTTMQTTADFVQLVLKVAIRSTQNVRGSLSGEQVDLPRSPHNIDHLEPPAPPNPQHHLPQRPPPRSADERCSVQRLHALQE